MASTTRSVLFTKVTFRVEVGQVSADQAVFVVGDGDVLGAWEASHAKRLSKKTMPGKSGGSVAVWELVLEMLTGVSVNYKYLIIGRDRRVKWESSKSDYRTVTPAGFETVVVDGAFGRETDEVWVDEGWINSDFQVRLELGYYDIFDGAFTPPISGPLVEEVDFSNTALSFSSNGPSFVQSSPPRPASHPPMSLHFFDGNSLLSREVIPLPTLDKWTEVVFHMNDLNKLKITVEVYDRRPINPTTRFTGESQSSNETERLARTCISKATLKDMRGIASVPLFNSQLEHVGNLNFKYLIITPFKHSLNNLSSIWKSYTRADKPIGKAVGHRGCGSTRTTFISENTILSFLTAADYGADYVEFDVQITKEGIPVINHDFHIPLTSSDGAALHVPVSTLTKRQFKSLRPSSSGDFPSPLSTVFQKMPRIKRSKSMSLLTKTSHRRRKPSKKPTETTKDTVKSPTSDVSVSDDSSSQPEEVNSGRRDLHDSSSSLLNHLEEASTGSSVQDFGLVGSSSYDSFDSISIMSSSSSSAQSSLAQRRDLASLDLAGARSVPGAAKKVASTAAASASSFKPLTTTFEVTREDLDLDGGTLEDDEDDGELGGSHPSGPASGHAPATKSIINPHDRLATLDETLRLVPSEVGFVIEVKYPAERFQIAEKMRYAERNAYADAVLNSVFNAMKNPQSASRKIMLISFDPDLCVLLSQKQPRFPVFFLLALGNGVPVGPGDDEIEGYDPRCQSIEMAIKFAKNVRLQGIICDAKTVLKSIQSAEEASSSSSLASSSSSTPPAMTNGITSGAPQTPTPSPTSSPSPALISTSSSFPILVHEAGLMLMTYGAENMDAEKRQIQKSAGVDSLIMDNVVHINREVRKRKQVSSLFLADYGRQNFKLAPAAPASTST